MKNNPYFKTKNLHTQNIQNDTVTSLSVSLHMTCMCRLLVL